MHGKCQSQYIESQSRQQVVLWGHVWPLLAYNVLVIFQLDVKRLPRRWLTSAKCVLYISLRPCLALPCSKSLIIYSRLQTVLDKNPNSAGKVLLTWVHKVTLPSYSILFQNKQIDHPMLSQGHYPSCFPSFPHHSLDPPVATTQVADCPRCPDLLRVSQKLVTREWLQRLPFRASGTI